MVDFAIRRLRPADSLEDLTQLLHRAFGELARIGIDCQCATQSAALTRERAERGECFIAVTGGTMVGTITLERFARNSPIPIYRNPATASVHQLAVDPAVQGNGVGGRLIEYAAAWARARRHDHLALDTPAGAHRQIAWYVGRGFSVSGQLNVAGRPYASVVLSKGLTPTDCMLHAQAARTSKTQSTWWGR